MEGKRIVNIIQVKRGYHGGIVFDGGTWDYNCDSLLIQPIRQVLAQIVNVTVLLGRDQIYSLQDI